MGREEIRKRRKSPAIPRMQTRRESSANTMIQEQDSIAQWTSENRQDAKFRTVHGVVEDLHLVEGGLAVRSPLHLCHEGNRDCILFKAKSINSKETEPN